MKTPVTTVDPDDSLHVADGVMSLSGIRVLEREGLVGIVTTSDVLRAVIGPYRVASDRPAATAAAAPPGAGGAGAGR